MKKKHKSVLWILICILLCTGCSADSGKEAEKGPYVYYINEKGTSLVRTAWDSSLTEGSAKEQAEEAMELLSLPASDIYKSAVPEGVEAAVERIEKGYADLSFNEAYRNMKKKDEVLMQAAIVQTLVQIEGIDRVGFLSERSRSGTRMVPA